MLFTIVLFVSLYLTFLSATIKPITLYRDARYEPVDTRFMFQQSSSISSANSCICLCLSSSICSMATHIAMTQICSLYVGQFKQEELRIAPKSWNATVYYLANSTATSLKILIRKNETIYAVWNTTAGSDSIPSSPGNSMGRYWPSQPPKAAFDSNISSYYTSHGRCNVTEMNAQCGEDTGVYFTFDNGPVLFKAFYFITELFRPARDPLTITIEGSNANRTLLTRGSSWTLIYNDVTGLANSTGRSVKGTMQMLPNVSTPFASYRLLVTSKRDNESSTSYAEFVMIYQ